MPTIKNKQKVRQTRKCIPSQKQLQIYSSQHANTFNKFEEEYEKTFRDSLKKEDSNIEDQLIKLFKTPFTPHKYTAQNDYYTYINYEWLAKKTNELKKPTNEKSYSYFNLSCIFHPSLFIILLRRIILHPLILFHYWK